MRSLTQAVGLRAEDEQFGQPVVDEIAQRCVATMVGEPKLQVTVHTSLVATLEQKLKALTAGREDAGEIIVAGDDAMPTSDCRIEWKHGSFARHTGQLWSEIERVVANMGASARFNAEARLLSVKELLSKTTETTSKE